MNAFGLTDHDIAELAQPQDSVHFMDLLHQSQLWAEKLVYVFSEDAEFFGDRRQFILGLLGAAYALGRLKGREDNAVTFIVKEEK